jgi:hypothetical protein
MSASRDTKIAAIQEARICLLASAAIKDSADPSDALVVLLSAPLSLFHGQLFEPAAFVERIKEQYGWLISIDAIEFFIPKLRAQGWLESRSDFPARGPYYVNLPEPDTEGLQAVDTRAALMELGGAFQAFAADVSPISILPKDALEAGALLLRYVVDTSAPLEKEPLRNEEDYLCARFVDEVNRKKLPLRETLSSLAAVGFLFRVADEIGHPTKRRKVKLSVVIDGPILLDFLGTAGATRAEASRDLFESLRVIGATPVTFAHCIEEAQDILRMILKAQPRDRYGPTGDALRKGLVHENVLRNLLNGFDVAVRSHGIQILPDTHEFLPQSHQYFDKDRADGLAGVITWHDNDNARYRDVDTAVLTIRRRAAHRTSDLFDSRFVCVTSNDAFAGATRRYLQEISYYNNRQVPPVVTLRELAARVWLEIGNKEKEDRLKIPQSQLLLSCDRALRYNRKVVEKAKTELAKVRPEQLTQFEMLLEVPRSARAVMDAALNNEKYVSGDNIEQLVEAAIQAAGEEVGKKERSKRIKEKEELTKKLTSFEEALEVERETSARQRDSIERLAESEKARDQETVEGLCQKANQQFRSIKAIVRALSALVVLPPMILAYQAFSQGASGALMLILALLALVLAFATAMDRPGAWLSKLIRNFLERSVKTKLADISRQDLANRLQMTWKDGVSTCSLEEEWIVPDLMS